MNKKQHIQLKLPRPLSHSSITLYNECPQKYKFRYIDAIPEKPRHYFSFGRSVHCALEFFYVIKRVMPSILFNPFHYPTVKRTAPPTLDELLKNYKKIWIAEGYRDQSQEVEYFEEGKRILTAFHEKHVKDFHVPLAVEYGFEIDVEGVPVKGFVDLIDRLPDGRLVIIDFKTGQGITPGRVEADPQLTMYQYACEPLLGAEAGELILYHLPTLTEHRSPRHGGRLVEALKTRIVNTAETITKKQFDPKPGMICRWCDFKPICPAFKDEHAVRRPDL